MRATISPPSIWLLTSCSVRPVSGSLFSICQYSGDGPRYFGNREGCRFQQGRFIFRHMRAGIFFAKQATRRTSACFFINCSINTPSFSVCVFRMSTPLFFANASNPPGFAACCMLTGKSLFSCGGSIITTAVTFKPCTSNCSSTGLEKPPSLPNRTIRLRDGENLSLLLTGIPHVLYYQVYQISYRSKYFRTIRSWPDFTFCDLRSTGGSDHDEANRVRFYSESRSRPKNGRFAV